MSKVDLFSKINLNRNTFTKVEQKIADYVLQNPQKVLYMSITDLAAACRVGDTSVFRFCKSLKFQGYQEFKMYLAQSIDIDDEFEGDKETAETDGKDNMNNLAMKILNNHIDALNETYSLINYDDIKKTVDFMIKAKRICFFGVGSSLITALDAKNKFMRVMPKVECTFDSHFQAMEASLLTADDLAIMISYSGSTKDIIETAKICKENSVTVVCVTRFQKSPLASYADLTLLCGANEGPLQGGSLSAKIAQLYIMDLLFNEYILHTRQASISNREKTASAILEKMY